MQNILPIVSAFEREWSTHHLADMKCEEGLKWKVDFE